VRLAVFDLDGTITRHDTLGRYALGFLLRRRPWRFATLPLVLPALLRYALGGSDRGGLKSAFIRATLGGCRREVLGSWTESFIDLLIPRGLFPQALEAIEAHARAGDHLVLMSASPDLYAPAIGRALGFKEVICTGLRWEGERLSGALATANRRGEEKVRCLEALRARHPGIQTVAYGNAASDLPHLRLAERGVLVNGSTAARREAVRAGITCVDWR
jgi:phosphatidylglycerophosphatase C